MFSDVLLTCSTCCGKWQYRSDSSCAVGGRKGDALCFALSASNYVRILTGMYVCPLLSRHLFLSYSVSFILSPLSVPPCLYPCLYPCPAQCSAVQFAETRYRLVTPRCVSRNCTEPQQTQLVVSAGCVAGRRISVFRPVCLRWQG